MDGLHHSDRVFGQLLVLSCIMSSMCLSPFFFLSFVSAAASKQDILLDPMVKLTFYRQFWQRNFPSKD